MITAMLEADGRRVGRYMSPHVADIRERLCLGNSFFDEEMYRAAGDELLEITEVRLPAAKNVLFDPANEDGEAPTYFELLTLYFFLCARYANCDAMVVETGMGGRLDCTNVVEPLVSVITIIELEHTAFLGNTIVAVAGEKAGIIKQGKPLILAKQSEEALEVFRKKAEEKQSPLFYFPEIAELSNLKINPCGTDFTLSFREPNLQTLSAPLSLSIPIPGKVQAENAALAIAAIKTAFPGIGEAAIRRGLEGTSLPARFERIVESPPFIIDGAHTPESLALCVETFCSLFGEGGILIFGCAADKDAATMAQIALTHFSKIIITTPGTFKISDPDHVYETFATIDREKTLLVKDTQEAVRQAWELSRILQRSYPRRENLPVLGTGSFYLAAEIRKVFKT